MPLFEYRCRSCASTFEALLSRAAADRGVRCEACGTDETDRLMGVPAVRADAALPVVGRDCPPPEAGPCGTGCCRLPG